MDTSTTETCSTEITRLLNGVRAGSGVDRDQLASLLHSELRKIAGRLMELERQGHSLQPTLLANDALMVLITRPDHHWQSRAHFFRYAAHAMRSVLVDHSRKRYAEKRGGRMLERVTFPPDLATNTREPEMLLALDQALTRLAEIDARQAEVVVLRYFGGLTEEEIAEAWDLSLRTVKREWSAAKAWLYAELTKPALRDQCG